MPEKTRVSQLLSDEPTLSLMPDAPLLDAAERLVDHNLDGAPVVDETGRVLGVITLADVIHTRRELHPPTPIVLLDAVLYLGSRRRFEAELAKVTALTVGDAMSSPAVTASPDDTIAQVSEKMLDRHLTLLPIVEDGRLAGVLSRRDVVRFILKGRAPE